ncbi:Uncharacterised protein [Bacteroides xylanisolvens]|nr:Uncharacterised protein [Bacteroides xylanisolvens]
MGYHEAAVTINVLELISFVFRPVLNNSGRNIIARITLLRIRDIQAALRHVDRAATIRRDDGLHLVVSTCFRLDASALCQRDAAAIGGFNLRVAAYGIIGAFDRIRRICPVDCDRAVVGELHLVRDELRAIFDPKRAAIHIERILDLDSHPIILRDIQRLDILVRIECQRSHLILNAVQRQRGIIQRHLVRDQRADASDVDIRFIHSNLVRIYRACREDKFTPILQCHLLDIHLSRRYLIIGIIIRTAYINRRVICRQTLYVELGTTISTKCHLIGKIDIVSTQRPAHKSDSGSTIRLDRFRCSYRVCKFHFTVFHFNGVQSGCAIKEVYPLICNRLVGC